MLLWQELYLQDRKRKRLSWKEKMEEPAEEELAAMGENERELAIR